MSTDKSLLDQFWKLTSENETQRIQAAFKIISHLQYKVTIKFLTFTRISKTNYGNLTSMILIYFY